MNLPDGEYWIYLRKSRKDIEAEARGEGETLAKHRTALFKLARERNLSITEVFPETESGETIIHRPEMIRMLKMMEIKPPKGVLVMDYDRLGRGDKIDQGMIENAFKENDVLVVTPSEVMDLNSESGEFNAEVKGFLARMELKQTTKRMQGGRKRSAESGNYIGTRPPYGYDIHKNDKSERYLVPNPEQSKVVRLIFDRYTNGNMGTNKIANELNEMGYKSYSGKSWTPPSILVIIKNEVYIGRIQWGKKESKKSKEAGKRRDTRSRPREEWIDVQGKHEPLVTVETFQKAQEILERKYHVPYQLENGITNPLAGVIRCDMCGASMILRPYTNQLPHLMCYSKLCENKSSRFAYVEDKLLEALDLYIQSYIIKHRKPSRNNVSVDIKRSAVETLKNELKELEDQKMGLHDFLERRIYDEETYLSRSQNLSQRIDEKKNHILAAEKSLQAEINSTKAQKDIIPKIKNVVQLYRKEKDPVKKNQLIKLVLHSATYRKEKSQRNDQFSLTLKPYIQ